MFKYDLETRILVWIDSFGDIDRKKKLRLFEELKEEKSIKNCLETDKNRFLDFLKEEELSELISNANDKYFEKVLSAMQRVGVYAITFFAKEYPFRLSEIEDFPLVLYCAGNFELLNEKMFTIVGSRRSLPLSVRIAEDFAAGLLNGGYVLLTGCADGVEKAVIDCACERGLGIVSVVAGGIDVALKGNVGLSLENVKNNGLIVSEKPLGINPKPFYFPLRNRLLAKLGEGVLIINGSKKSGVKYTAEYALKYGKKLYAVPYNLNVQSGEITNLMIKSGAFLVTDPTDITGVAENVIKTESIELTAEESELFDIIKRRPIHIEEICKTLNKAVYEITPVISMLEIKGLIMKEGVNVYGATLKTED